MEGIKSSVGMNKSTLKLVQIATRRASLGIKNAPQLKRTATLHTQGPILSRFCIDIPWRRCLSSLKNDSYTDLKKWSQQWLEDTHNTRWTQEDLSIAQYLLQKWVDDCPGNDRLAATKWAVRILRRWLQCEQKSSVKPKIIESALLADNLHRLLHVLAQLEETSTRKDPKHSRESSTICRQLSVDLLNDFSQAATHLQDPILQPGNKALTMVLNTIAKRPDVRGSTELAQELVESHLKYGHDPVDLTTYSTYLHVLSCCSPYNDKAPKLAEAVLIGMEAPDTKCYGAVIRAWAGVPDFNAAERAQFWFDRCLEKNVFDNKTATITFNIVLNAWGRLGHAERAEEFLLEAFRLCDDGRFAFQGPDNLSFLMVLNAWNRSKIASAPERVSKLLSMMKSLCDNHQFQLSNPSIEIYNAALETWAQKPDSGSQVESMVQQLEQDYERSGDPNQRPSLKSYVASIRAWANTNSEDAIARAQAIVKKLEYLGAKGADEFIPDTMVYTALMQVWANSNRDPAVDKVVALLNKMQLLARSGRRQAIPSVVTYNIVLHTLVKHDDLDLAVELLMEMVDNSSSFVPKPDTISYTTVMHGLQHTNNPLAAAVALEILGKMEQLDTGNGELISSNSVYEAALNVLVKHPGEGRPEAAESILWRSQKRFESGMSAYGPNYRLCNAVLKCWARSKEGFAPERAEALFEWMQKTSKAKSDPSLAPNFQTMNLMIQVWAVSKRKGAWYRVQELYNTVKQDEKLLPSSFTFNQVLIALKNSDAEDKPKLARGIFQDMLLASKEHIQCTPGNQTFHLLVDLCVSHTTKSEVESKNLLKAILQAIETEGCKISSPLEAKLRDVCQLFGVGKFEVKPRCSDLNRSLHDKKSIDQLLN